MKNGYEWVANVRGCKHGFKVRPIEQCVCITKLLYFRPELGVAESRFANPVKIREATEGYINKVRLDKNCDGWVFTLGDLYSEDYAQFDCIDSAKLTGMLRNYEKLVIVDQRTTSNPKELQFMSCFNIR